MLPLHFISRRVFQAILLGLILASLVSFPLTKLPSPGYANLKGKAIIPMDQQRLILIALDASALEEEGKLFPFLEGIAAYAQRHSFPLGLYFIGETLTELVSRTTDLENIQWKELDYPKSNVTNAALFYRMAANLQRTQPQITVSQMYIGSGIINDEAVAIQLALAAKNKTKTELFTVATKHANTEVLLSLASPRSYYALSASPRADELFGGGLTTPSSPPTVMMQPEIRMGERDGPCIPVSITFNLLSSSSVIPAGTEVVIEGTDFHKGAFVVLKKDLDYFSSREPIHLVLGIRESLQTPKDEIEEFAGSTLDIRFVTTTNPEQKKSVLPVTVFGVASAVGIRIPMQNIELIFGPLVRAWAGMDLLLKFVLIGAPGAGKTCLLDEIATAFCPTYERLGKVGSGNDHVTNEIVEYNLLQSHIGQACYLPMAIIDTFGVEKAHWTTEFSIDLASGRLANGTTVSSLKAKEYQAKPGAQLLSTPDFVVALINIGDILDKGSWEITANVTKWMTPYTTTGSNFVVISKVDDTNRGYLIKENLDGIKVAMKIDNVDIFVVNARKGVKSAENDISAIKFVFSVLPAKTGKDMRQLMAAPSRYYSGTYDTAISKWAVDFVNSHAWNSRCTYVTVFVVVVALLIIAPDAIEFYLRRFANIPAAPANGGPPHGGGGGPPHGGGGGPPHGGGGGPPHGGGGGGGNGGNGNDDNDGGDGGNEGRQVLPPEVPTAVEN